MNKKWLALIFSAAILIGNITLITSAQANAPQVTINSIASLNPGQALTISGTSSYPEVVVKVIDVTKNVVEFIDTVQVLNSSYTIKFNISSDASIGSHKVIVGLGSEVTTQAFTVTAPLTPPIGGGGTGIVPSNNTDIVFVEKGGTVTLNGAMIAFPSGVVKGNVSNFKVTVDKLADTSILPVDSASKLISDVYEISKDVTGEFNKSVQITLSYDKNSVNLSQSTVSIYWFNEETKKWIQLDNPQVDSINGTVSGTVNHFTKFAVLATAKSDIPVTFSDTKGHWAEKSILELVEKGSVSGYPDGTFKPNNNITRAEFVAIIVKALNLKEQDGKIFADTSTHWAKNAIATAAALGIISGYNEVTFGPNDLISREQMAAIIVKAVSLDSSAVSTTYTDNSEISEWAKVSIETVTSKGIMNGYQDGTLKPKGNSTRAEAVTVILRALAYKK